MRDPDGYIIEVGQYSPAAIEDFKRYLANKKQASLPCWEGGAMPRRPFATISAERSLEDSRFFDCN